MNHLRVPLFLADRDPSVVMAWLYLLRAWFSGEYPSVRDIARRGPISVGSAQALRKEAYAWASASGWKLPPSACPEVPSERSRRTQTTVHGEHETAGSTDEAAYTVNGAERSPCTLRAIGRAPAIPCRRTEKERDPERAHETDLDSLPDARSFDSDRPEIDSELPPSPSTVGNAAPGSSHPPTHSAGAPGVHPTQPNSVSGRESGAVAPRDDRGGWHPPPVIHAHGQPDRVAAPPAVIDDIDARVVEAIRRVPGARLLLQGDAPIRTWAALRSCVAYDLRDLPGRASAALVAECRLRRRHGDEQPAEPEWARAMAPATEVADPDAAAWDRIWAEPSGAIGQPAPDGLYSPPQYAAIRRLGGRKQIRQVTTYDLPKLKATFLALCRGQA